MDNDIIITNEEETNLLCNYIYWQGNTLLPSLFKYIGERRNIFLVSITKTEVDFLLSNGVPYHENGISVTHSNSGKTWYLTETNNNMKLLNEFRNRNIVRR